MWHALYQWISTAPSGSLNSDAVIEIMIALLGVMITVLTLISGIITIGFGVLAFIGFETLKKAAEQKAEEKAAEIATKIAAGQQNNTLATAQAGLLSEGQVVEAQQNRGPTPEEAAKDAAATPVTTDDQLSEQEETK